MTVIVTGAAGHVGVNLVALLVRRGIDVRAVDRVAAPPALTGLPVAWVRADVRDAASLRDVFVGADLVYHLAARISVTGDPDGSVRATNVDGVRTVAEAALAAGVRRVVHCSSVHAFDLERCVPPLTEEAARSTDPRLPAYDRSKAAGEAALREVVARGLDAVVVNPTGIVGPMDPGPSRMGRLLLALRDARLPAVLPGGFDWVDVRDVAASIVAAGERGRTGEGYLLPGHWCSLHDLAVVAHDVTGCRVPRTVPMALARAWSPMGTRLGRATDDPLKYTGEALHAIRFGPRVDGEKARSELGHAARPLEETVRDLYGWFVGSGA